MKKLLKRLYKDFTLWFLYPLIYRKYAQKPAQKGLVLFLETKEKEMPNAFDLLYKRVQKDSDKSAVYETLNQNESSKLQYTKNCASALKQIAAAEVVFLADASDLVSCLPLRLETKVVQLWHACGAFKKWGMSTAELKFGGSREQLLRHPFYKNLSLVTVSSPEVAWAYEEAMVLEDRPEIIKPLGVSRTDVFFDPVFSQQARKTVENCVPAVKDKKIILYAPTFRGHVSQAKGPDQLDITAMRQALSCECVLLIKHHPFVKELPPVPEGCEDFAFDVSNELSIDELLPVTDVCISDYSSLVFEYSLFGRPMAFFAYDLDDYNDWRGFYYSYEELTPGPVFTENAPLIDYLQHVEERFDRAQVDAFRAKFMSSCDGNATERICNSVF